MLIADSTRQDLISENVKNMQRDCIAMLEILSQYIEMLPNYPENRAKDRDFRSFDRERATPGDISRAARFLPSELLIFFVTELQSQFGIT
jgi:hypothetical protein